MPKLKMKDPVVKEMVKQYRQVKAELPAINAATKQAETAARQAIRDRRAALKQRDTLRAALLALHPGADPSEVDAELDDASVT